MLLRLSISCHTHTHVRRGRGRMLRAGVMLPAPPLESRSEDASPARPSRSLTSRLCQRGAPRPGGAARAELVTQRTSSLCSGSGASPLGAFPRRDRSRQEVHGYLCPALVHNAELNPPVLPTPGGFPCPCGVAPATAASPGRRELSQCGQAGAL